MNIKSKPFISIITPVYNGEKYLAECIESVIAQTYDNWEYVVVNNCSQDKSLEIAESYVAKDNRIRIHNNEQFLDLMPNWNHAIRQISNESKYCKVVHADDWIFPECIEKMVKVAEKYPSIGIIGAYRLDENQVNLDGLGYLKEFIPGREICRMCLMDEPYIFGSPTSLLIRSDLIRKRRLFYNEDHIHADKEVCFDLLQESDFGFVHQVLTFTRRHNETETTHSKKINTYRIGKLLILKKYGPIFLNSDEYNRQLKLKIEGHYSYLVRTIFDLKDQDFFHYHFSELKKLGIKINPIKLIIALIKELLNPLNVVIRLKNGFKQKRYKKKYR